MLWTGNLNEGDCTDTMTITVSFYYGIFSAVSYGIKYIIFFVTDSNKHASSYHLWREHGKTQLVKTDLCI